MLKIASLFIALLIALLICWGLTWVLNNLFHLDNVLTAGCLIAGVLLSQMLINAFGK
jgi:hypothetical protein